MTEPDTDDRLDRLSAVAERLANLVAEQRPPTMHKTVLNLQPERAAWVCSIMCAVAVTIAVLQAFQIQTIQAKYDVMETKNARANERMQDYLNYIYQQNPHLKPPEKK